MACHKNFDPLENFGPGTKISGKSFLIGVDDCGVFAIVFATAFCDDVDPYSLSEKLNDLANCFEEGEMLPFPRRFGRRRVKKVRTVRVVDRHDTSLGIWPSFIYLLLHHNYLLLHHHISSDDKTR